MTLRYTQINLAFRRKIMVYYLVQINALRKLKLSTTATIANALMFYALFSDMSEVLETDQNFFLSTKAGQRKKRCGWGHL